MLLSMHPLSSAERRGNHLGQEQAASKVHDVIFLGVPDQDGLGLGLPMGHLEADKASVEMTMTAQSSPAVGLPGLTKPFRHGCGTFCPPTEVWRPVQTLTNPEIVAFVDGSASRDPLTGTNMVG